MKQKRFTSWSYTRHNDYRRCPLAAKLKHLDKIMEPKGPPLIHGAEVHNGMEFFLKGTTKKLPLPLTPAVKKLCEKLRKQYLAKDGLRVIIEDTWAFTQAWEVTTWDDWDRCWLRVKVDVAQFTSPTEMEIIDWKTGKFRMEMTAEYEEQLELYALGALMMFPKLEAVRPRLIYLEAQLEYPSAAVIYCRGMVPKLMTDWAKRVRPMMKDQAFVPKPNQFCRWCHYRASNHAAGGGQCKY